MQGVVTDDKGVYVKAAIVKLIKIRDSNEESEPEAVTYAETDEEGKFIFQELNSDEKYFIEIYIDHSESSDKKGEAVMTEASVPTEETAEPEKTEELLKADNRHPQNDDDFNADEPNEEMIDYLDGNGIIDSLKTNNMIDDVIRGSISICNLNYMSGLNLKDKSYLTKSNLW